MPSGILPRTAGYVLAVLGVAAVTAVGVLLRDLIAAASVALAYLLVVLFVAAGWGRWPAFAASVLGTLCLNFFFLPPIHTFTIADPTNWVALGAFLITSIIAGHLSERAKRRAADAEADRQQARSASAYHRSLLEASLDPLVTIGSDGKITDVNTATETATGHPRNELIGTRFSEYFTSPERAEAGYQLAFRDGSVRDYELELRHRDGHTAAVLYNASIYRNIDGNVGGLFAAARDITARKRVEQALRASEANLNKAQEIAYLGSWYLDVAQDRLAWSDEVFRIFALDKGAPLTYESFLATVHPDDLEFVNQSWAAAMHGAPYDIEHRIVVAGEVKWVRERAQVDFDADGKAVRGIGTVQDITQRKQAEAEIRALNADLEKRVLARTAELQQAREREIEVGYRIQQTLLLDKPPRDIAGLRVAALTIPSRRIDGDFYVFIKHPDQRLDVIVGDVMGKGVPAALLGAATKSQFLGALSRLTELAKNGRLPDPKDIVTLAHVQVARQLIDLESFVTLAYVRLDLNQHSFDLVDCGHTGVIHWHGRTGLYETVRGNNLPLGVREGEIFEQVSVPLEAGDLLLFYSDGVTEARNPAGDQFGDDRLRQCVISNSKVEPDALVEAVRNAVVEFSGSSRFADDLTCVAIRVEEATPALARAQTEIRSDLRELRRARKFVRAFCAALPGRPMDPDTIAQLELAVTEAASNVIKHAYHGRTDQHVQLDAEAFVGHVSIRLHHLGDPFDPSAVVLPPLDVRRESGFGLYLMAGSVDEIRYDRDERGRNCITLVKNLQLNGGKQDGNSSA